MSDATYLGRRIRSFDSFPQFDGFSGVEMIVSDDEEYFVGTNAGRVLTVSNPFGTEAMAQDILTRIKGHQYQPYTAERSFLDPAAELGDGVTVYNEYGGIFKRNEYFGPLYNATIAAPGEETLDHEFPFVAKQDRSITRRLRGLTTELKVQDGKISAQIEKVEGLETDVSNLEQTASSIQTEVQKISGLETDVSNLKQTASSIQTEVQKISGLETDVSNLEQTASSISAEVQTRVAKEGGNSSSFGWELTDSKWVLKSNGVEVFAVNKDGASVSGHINAKSGTIGGFDIWDDYISYNDQYWDGTNSIGIYLGTKGLQLGNKFFVSSDGELWAYNGRFTGTVYAGSIAYGEEAGKFDGAGLADKSVAGGVIGDYTLSAGNFDLNVRESLGAADFSANVFEGLKQANYVWANAGVFKLISLGGYDLMLKTIVINGVQHQVVKWGEIG